MTRLSLTRRWLLFALMFSVLASHAYGAWHRVAHGGHAGHALHTVGAAAQDDGLGLSLGLGLDAAQRDAAGLGERGSHAELGTQVSHAPRAEHKHSCLSLDGVCSAPTPIVHGSAPLLAPAEPQQWQATAHARPLGHSAWAHALARAPPDHFKA